VPGICSSVEQLVDPSSCFSGRQAQLNGDLGRLFIKARRQIVATSDCPDQSFEVLLCAVVTLSGKLTLAIGDVYISAYVVSVTCILTVVCLPLNSNKFFIDDEFCNLMYNQ